MGFINVEFADRHVKKGPLSLLILDHEYRVIMNLFHIIVWQRFCEPSPDLGFPSVCVCVCVCVCVRVCVFTFCCDEGNCSYLHRSLPVYWILSEPKGTHALPDTADCKSVHLIRFDTCTGTGAGLGHPGVGLERMERRDGKENEEYVFRIHRSAE